MIEKKKLDEWNICDDNGNLICYLHAGLAPRHGLPGALIAVQYRLCDPNGDTLIQDITKSAFFDHGPLKDVAELVDKTIKEYGLEKLIDILEIDKL
jgi:hypothetical protein